MDLRRIVMTMEPKFQWGDKVRIKDNAFPGSDDPRDIEARGKIVEIVDFGKDGEIECWDDEGELYTLLEDEIELA